MGGKSSTTKVDNEPPAWAAPLFKEGAADALSLYNKGVGGKVYQGNTVAGQSQRTQNALGDLYRFGSTAPTFQLTKDRIGAIGSPMGPNTYADQIAQRSNNLSFTPQSLTGFDEATSAARGIADPADNYLTGIASGVNGVKTEGDYRNLLTQAGNKSAAEQYLTDTASGAYLSDGNPYYRQRLDKEISDATAKMQTMYAGKGRYGSMTAQKGIGEMTGNMLLQGLESDYNRERENQLRAVGMIDDQRNSAFGNKLSAVSGITGVQGQNLANQMSAAGQMSNARAAEAGMLGQMAESKFGAGMANQQAANQTVMDRANMLNQAGQLEMAQTDQKLQANQLLQSIQQQEFENQLTGANAALQAGQLTDEYNQKQLDDQISRFYANDNAAWNRLAMLFSAAQGSAGTYGTQTQTSRQPMDIMGLFGSLLSDRRLKTGVVRVGHDPRGFGIYEFGYKAAPDARWRGVMADEVERVAPEAVVDMGSYKMVNYDRLGLTMEAA